MLFFGAILKNADDLLYNKIIAPFCIKIINLHIIKRRQIDFDVNSFVSSVHAFITNRFGIYMCYNY
jgi:hypothetical protein